MLTQNRLAARIFGQLVELRSGKNATRGGSSETDVKDPTAIPAGVTSPGCAVMTHTPVGYCPRTWRNHFGSVGRRSAATARESTIGSTPSGRAGIVTGIVDERVDTSHFLLLILNDPESQFNS